MFSLSVVSSIVSSVVSFAVSSVAGKGLDEGTRAATDKGEEDGSIAVSLVVSVDILGALFFSDSEGDGICACEIESILDDGFVAVSDDNDFECDEEGVLIIEGDGDGTLVSLSFSEAEVL